MKRLAKRIAAVILLITLVCTYGGFYSITVAAKTSEKIKVSKLTITKPNSSTLVLQKGKNFTLKTKVSPSNATIKKLEYRSSNSEVASITSWGKITANKNGSATITIKTTDGSKKAAILNVRVGIPVTKIIVNNNDKTVTVGDQVQLRASARPYNASVKTVKWSSSDTQVAQVDNSGLVTTKALGKVTITATAKDGSGKKATCTILVTEIKPTKITLNMTNKSLKVKESIALQATIEPSNATNQTITWSSSNEEVATVDTKGRVVSIKEGYTTITATSKGDLSIKAICLVTVIPETMISQSPINTDTNTPIIPPETGEEYKLVWSDNFSGDSINLANWNMEVRDPGWVNNELQAYTDSEDNIYVEDDKLVIKANKVATGDSVSYTSGKVTTQHKQIFKYGKFEVKAKVPSGQGLWPAIWMMPEDESLYGSWPRCGEIDIMEILGNEPNKLYGTLHFGNPHTSSQGTKILSSGSFADDYHVYTVEWEPSQMRFYVDGNLYHTVNDWFTKVEGQGEITYPAPFDQPFYLQLNLAVGGSWPGNPDETTNFDQAKLLVDYVNVYQLVNYNENVEKPVKEVVLRNPDSTGNYMINGDFNVVENLTDTADWYLLTTLSGQASASIMENKLKIDTVNAGTANYSVQFVQPNLPMKKGGNYRLTFDAKASDNRSMIVNVTAPDRQYIRYMADTTANLTTNVQSYSYEFSMTNENDANGRVEFNLGNQNSIASVEISNVKLIKVSETAIDNSKTVLADGNYVYNGGFQEGTNRLSNWDIIRNQNDAKVTVTNSNNIRELKAEVPDTVTTTSDVILKQSGLAISTNKTYRLSFDAYGKEAKTIQAKMNGQTFDVAVTSSIQNFEYHFSTGDTITSADLEFLLGVVGTTYLDNVRIVEEGMLINGDFSNGMVGWSTYIDSSISSKVSYVISNSTQEKAIEFSILDTADQGYKIQLMQRNVTLEQGKWYKLSLDAKSDMARKLMFALQKDGSSDNDWTPYSGEKIVDLGSSYKTYEIVFQMKNSTDTKTILSISMGAVGGIQITDAHKLWIDNVKLEETTAPVIIGGGELIKNGDFSQGKENWTTSITSPGASTSSFDNNKATFQITNLGTTDWHIQLKQSGLVFEKDKTYQVKMTMTSSVDRTVKIAYMSTNYAWYGGADVQLLAGAVKEVDMMFTMNNSTDSASDLVISMGYIQDTATNVGTMTIENISIKEQ